MAHGNTIHYSILDPFQKRMRKQDPYFANIASVHAFAACNPICAPFSGATKDYCCKQHAINDPKPAPAPTKYPPITPAPGPSPSKSSKSKKKDTSTISDVHKENCKKAYGDGSCTTECSAGHDSESCDQCKIECNKPDVTNNTSQSTTTTPATTTTTPTTTTTAPASGSVVAGAFMQRLFDSVCATSKIPILCNSLNSFTAVIVVVAVMFLVLILKRL